jgi:hypothetical protein
MPKKTFSIALGASARSNRRTGANRGGRRVAAGAESCRSRRDTGAEGRGRAFADAQALPRDDHDTGERVLADGQRSRHEAIATAAAVSAAVAVTSAVVGSIVNAPPAGCVPVNYGGMIYQQCGSTWYPPQGAQYVVVNPPR